MTYSNSERGTVAEVDTLQAAVAVGLVINDIAIRVTSLPVPLVRPR